MATANTCKIAILLITLTFFVNLAQSNKVHYIHWNRANPMFRMDNTDHVVDVNAGNLRNEFDQVNIICPVTKPGTRYPERHVVYSVSREEYESCRVTNPSPKIVAVCSKPHQLLYFTITFRSFTPTPGGLEFYPGQDYYFISTSSATDLHRRVGGGCATHNMRMIFRVADNGADARGIQQVSNDLEMVRMPTPSTTTTTSTTTTKVPKIRFNNKAPYSKNKYYVYHPRDLFIEDNSIESFNEIETYENDVGYDQFWQGDGKQAMKYTSGAMNTVPSNGQQTGLLLTSLLLCIWVKFLVD